MDDHLIRGLGDAESRMLVEWLVDWAEMLADTISDEELVEKRFYKVRSRAQLICCYLRLCQETDAHASLTQFTATQKLPWPLPTLKIDTIELLDRILDWESRHYCHSWTDGTREAPEFFARQAA